MSRQVIHFYTLCWNDERMLPFFFRHYDELIDHYYIYDNGSTDSSLALLAAHPRTTAQSFVTEDDSFGVTEVRMSDTIWRHSIGRADWVVMTDLDEHLYHPDLRGYLAECSAAGVTVLDSIGYEMIAESFPPPEVRLSEHVRRGVRSLGHDKLCIFDPAAVTATNFRAGRHTALPQGRIVWPTAREIKMLHYKKLGADYLLARHQSLSQGLGSHDVTMGFGRHYLWEAGRTREDFEGHLQYARPVPGLDGDISGALDEDEIERLISRSGLVDEDYYYSHYRDVANAMVDPVRHFCLHGWQEGRRPNAWFDTEWYIAQHDCHENPLLHYLTIGEPAGAAPSPDFDPEQYRQKHGLAGHESPLAHCVSANAIR
jgi:hypothetical protein